MEATSMLGLLFRGHFINNQITLMQIHKLQRKMKHCHIVKLIGRFSGMFLTKKFRPRSVRDNADSHIIYLIR